MAADGILKVNHRELILSSQKKARFGFLRISADLQDQIIDGMDANTMTVTDASRLIAEHGSQLSPQAIAGYYSAVRGRRADLLTRITA